MHHLLLGRHIRRYHGGERNSEIVQNVVVNKKVEAGRQYDVEELTAILHHKARIDGIINTLQTIGELCVAYIPVTHIGIEVTAVLVAFKAQSTNIYY